MNQFGEITFNFNGVDYIIDDNHQQQLVYAGYIIRDNYDNLHQMDSKRGFYDREDLRDLIYGVLCDILEKNQNVFKNMNINFLSKDNLDISLHFSFDKTGCVGEINFSSISSIVSYNNAMKIKKLPFLPFIKSMDKYNTYYFSIFVKENGSEFVGSIDQFEMFIDRVIYELNTLDNHKYNVKICPIRQRVIRWMNKKRRYLSDTESDIVQKMVSNM